ncbi:MAG: hypothetical protein AAGF75_02570 [Cyanobacteria bacterium P01_H01_bin.130]
MLNITLGFTVCLSLVALLRCWGLSRDIRTIGARLNRMEGAIGNLTHRIELRTSDERQRVRQLEDKTQVNQGQLKFLLNRIQRVESFLKDQGYQTIAPTKGTTENVSRLDLKPQRVPKPQEADLSSDDPSDYNLCAIPPGNHAANTGTSDASGTPARYIKPNRQATAKRVKDMWGLGH